MKLLWFLAFPLFTLVRSQCPFTKTQAQNETRLITTFEYGKYKLFLKDVMQRNEVLYLICGANDIITVKCKTNGKFNITLPTDDCENPLKSSVEPISDSTCPATMYRIGFKVGNEFLELYRSCYDVTALRPLFTLYDADPFNLVTDRPASSHFTGDGVFPLNKAVSFQARKIHERFKKLFGNNQQYITSDRIVVIDRGHLVPSADYLHTYNMIATNKYLNVMPEFSSINRGNWKIIEDFIRKLSAQSTKLRVITGTLGILSLPDASNRQVPIHLLDSQQNPIPEWIYKIAIDGPQKTTTFLTYNNIFSSSRPSPNCNAVTCPGGIDLAARAKSGYTFCCDTRDFVKRNVPYLSPYF